MELLTAALSALLGRVIRLLPAGRREWADALRGEAEQAPAGRARLSWLVGGFWLVTREAMAIRRVAVSLAGLLAGAILVWLDWHPGSENPAMPTNRMTGVIIAVVLAGLPWLVRPLIGPVADNRAARIVRAGSYSALYLVLLVMTSLSRFASSRFDHMHAFDQNNWESDMRSGAVVSAVLVIGMMAGYALTILLLTARRTSIKAGTLAAGAGCGTAGGLILYGLAPLGNGLHPHNGWLAAGYHLAVLLPVAAPVAAGVLARRGLSTKEHLSAAGTRSVSEGYLGSGVIAGLCAGGAAALLVNILTIGTMLLMPRQVELRWANPSPRVEHGTPYEIQMSVGDAAIKYEVGLLLLPFAGLVLGAVGSLGLDGQVDPVQPLARRKEPEVAVRSSQAPDSPAIAD